MPLPLTDIRILDLTRLLPGGFCTQVLPGFGADVIKVEDTGAGDYVRLAPPYYDGDEDSVRSALFLSLNGNKRSVQIDLKTDEGREALLTLSGDADEQGGHPTSAAGQIADLGGGGLMAAIGILLALRERDHSGLGQAVDVSMFDGALSWMAMPAAAALAEGRSQRRGEWAAFASEHDCCLEPVLEVDEVLGSELVAAREMVVTLDQPGVDRPVRVVGPPVKLSRTPADPARRPAPALGEHTQELLTHQAKGLATA